MQRGWRRIRPLEWVLLTFIGAVTLKVGPSAAVRGASAFFQSRSHEVFLGLLVVVTLQQVVHAVRTPWADRLHPLRLKLLVWLPVALLPLLVGVGNSVFDEALWDRLEGPFDAFTVLKVLLVTVQVLGVGAPTLLVWLGLWDLGRREGQVRAAVFVRQAVPAIGASLRDWVPLLMLVSGYAWVGQVMDLSVTEGIDDSLRRADFVLFRTDPVVALQALISRPLSVWLAFAYSMYAVFYVVCPSAIWLTAGREAFRELALRLGVAMAVAWFSYLVFPAKGPVLAQTFSVPLDLYLLAPVKEALMDARRITWDCFPSMHTCATLIFWSAAWKHARWLFWVMAPVALSIPFACVYLRYHYVVDVLAGALLAVLTLALRNPAQQPA